MLSARPTAGFGSRQWSLLGTSLGQPPGTPQPGTQNTVSTTLDMLPSRSTPTQQDAAGPCAASMDYTDVHSRARGVATHGVATRDCIRARMRHLHDRAASGVAKAVFDFVRNVDRHTHCVHSSN